MQCKRESKRIQLILHVQETNEVPRWTWSYVDDRRPEEPTSPERGDREYHNKEMETPGEHSFTVFPFLFLFASLSPHAGCFPRSTL